MMRVIRLFCFTVAAGAVSFAAMIDNFNGSLYNQMAQDNSADGIRVTSVLGGRSIFADKLGSGNSNYIDATVAATAEGTFEANAGYDVYGFSGAVYTGLWDLAASAQGFSIDLIGNDLVGSTIMFWISDGTHTANSPASALAVVPPEAPPQTIYADFGSFTGIGSVNLAAITSLGFTNPHVTNGDLALDNFETMVPEPGTYAIMGATLLGLFAFRRKRR